MRVLVIPEDSRRDQYVLKPIITAMMTALGQPRAKVQICSDPIMQGVSEALKWPRIQLILEQYRGMVDLFLLCVDRDGDVHRRASLDYIEQQARVAVPAGRNLSSSRWSIRLYRHTSSFSLGKGEEENASAAAERRLCSQGSPGRAAADSGVNVDRTGASRARRPAYEPRQPY